MMNKVLVAILVAGVVLLVLLLVAVRSARRVGEELVTSPSPTATAPVSTPSPLPTPSPTPAPEVLTPEKTQLLDVEAAEETETTLDSDVDRDLEQFEAELKGV